MHKLSILTWFYAAACSLAEHSSPDMEITPCISGLNIFENSCKIPDNNNSTFIYQHFIGDDDCLSDDCPSPLQPHWTTHKSSPWTHKPQCESNLDGTQSFCVYTDTNFGHGRGISFFTSPGIASHLSHLPAFADSRVHEHIDFSAPRPYEIRYVSGRGNGLFATRELRRGDLILADLPVGVYSSNALAIDHEEDYALLSTAFDQLPKRTRELFMDMAIMHEGGNPVMERININAFHGIFQQEPHFLLYSETAKMNHACRPNSTMSYHDSETLIHATHASRTILPGEEITITYIGILQSRSARQTALSNYWGFTCTCSHCSAPHEHIAASDARTEEILNRQSALRDWSPSSAGTPKMAEELIKLYSDEHIYSAVATGYVLAALEHNAVGNSAMAKRYGEAAVEAGLVTAGVDSDVEDMKALVKNPILHWSYRKRAEGGQNILTAS
ncbi:hypothetical protein B7494_g8194 [Chlorociboria aeruginascens]|nr:hypothetical protein B7494_g8194 [Chlorociboria aeruginascens]